MTEEFNLSKKIIGEDEDVGIKGDLQVQDVKEFINRLKIEIAKLNHFSQRNFKIVLPQIIDKLAGEKLK